MGNASSVPNDVLAWAASFAHEDRHICTPKDLPPDYLRQAMVSRDDRRHESLVKKQFLSLRAVSRRGRDLVQLAVETRSSCMITRCVFRERMGYPSAMAYPSAMRRNEMAASPRCVEAMGRVFGAGCVDLKACGVSVRSIFALYKFVLSTNGGLVSLSLQDAAVSSDMLYAMCRAAPNLVSLTGPRRSTSYDAIEAISDACPMLEEVSFTTRHQLSPAEFWARHYPALKCLDFSNGQGDYTPTKIEAIRELALVTNATSLNLDGCHIGVAVVDAIVGTPLGDRLESFGEHNWGNGGLFTPEAILAATRGFPRLVDLTIPDSSPLRKTDYLALGRAANNLKSLAIWARNATDDCVAAVCLRARLRKLVLQELPFVSRGLVDGILAGETAKTLEQVEIDCANGIDFYGTEDEPRREDPLRATDVLRLVSGCPNLKHFKWWLPRDHTDDAELWAGTLHQINELLVGRGGTEIYFETV